MLRAALVTAAFLAVSASSGPCLPDEPIDTSSYVDHESSVHNALLTFGKLMTSGLPLYCNNSVIELSVESARLYVEDVGTITTRLYRNATGGCNETLYPAPPIIMEPGSRCQIKLINNLEAGQSSACPFHANERHCPDTTALHTHGLHVSPKQDKVGVSANPGESVVYVYDIPEDHAGGTHWYHASYHGSSETQVTGGLLGPLLIPHTSPSLTIPTELADLYDESNPFSYLMTLTHFNGEAQVEATNSYSDVTIDPNFDLERSSSADVFLVNGRKTPRLKGYNKHPFLLRLVNAAVDSIINLVLRESISGDVSPCEMYLLARDGVFQPDSYPLIDSIFLLPGGRADVMVKCSYSKSSAYGDQLAIFQAVPLTDTSAPSEMMFSGTNVAILYNIHQDHAPAGTPVYPFPPTAGPIPEMFPSYLTDAKGSATNEVPTGGVLTDSVVFGEDSDGTSTINGAPFGGFGDSTATVGDMCLNGVYQLTASTDSATTQVYHQQTNPFTVVTRNAMDTDAVATVGEWRDVILASGYTIQVAAAGFDGSVMFNSKFLKSSDAGMMAKWNVSPCGEDQSPEVDESGGDELLPLVYAPAESSDDSSGIAACPDAARYPTIGGAPLVMYDGLAVSTNHFCLYDESCDEVPQLYIGDVHYYSHGPYTDLFLQVVSPECRA